MKMKKLTLAALIASGLSLMACEDSDNAKNQKAETPAVVTAPVAEPSKAVEAKKEEPAKSAFDLAKVAENAQMRYESQARVAQTVYDAQFKPLSPIVQFNFSTSDYTRQEQGATAKSHIKIKFDQEVSPTGESLDFDITGVDTISYSEALWNDGVEARVESKILFADNLIKAFGIDPSTDTEQLELFRQMESAIHAKYDLLKDKNVESEFEMAPIEFKSKDGQAALTFKGFKGTGKYNEDGVLALLGSGEYHYDFAGLEAKEGEKVAFEAKPFKLDYSLSEKGELKLSSSSLEVLIPEEKVSLKIGELHGKGELKAYDTLISGYLGTSHISANNIEVSLPEFEGKTYNFGSLHLSSSADLMNDKYQMQAKLAFDINDKTIKALVPELPANVDFKTFSIAFDAKNLSKELAKKFVEISGVQAELEENPELAIELMGDVIDSMVRDQSVMAFDTQLDTSLGQVNGHLTITPAEGASFDKADFVQRAKTGEFSEEELMSLVNVEGVLTGDKKLLDDTGASMMLMMVGGEFVEEVDEQYRVQFAVKKGEVTVNGKALPQ